MTKLSQYEIDNLIELTNKEVLRLMTCFEDTGVICSSDEEQDTVTEVTDNPSVREMVCGVWKNFRNGDVWKFTREIVRGFVTLEELGSFEFLGENKTTLMAGVIVTLFVEEKLDQYCNGQG